VETEGDAGPKPLEGLRVVTTANALPSAIVGLQLADAGAEVWLLEPPGGSRLRSSSAWELWSRGQHSLCVDLRDPADRARARALIARSDVFVDNWASGVAARLGLAADDLCAEHPHLVHARISAFGDDTRFAGAEGWESAVMAVMGGPQGFSSLTLRPGPAFVSTPYASVGAAHLTVQGVLGALVERERSGQGQQVEVSLARALVAFDTWNWLLHVLADRYSQAFSAGTAIDAERLVPHTPMFFRLLVGMSKDGQWLQFSQTTDRLWHAFLRACDLDPDDPEILGMENHEDDDVRVRFWEMLLAAVRRRTADEWSAVFDDDPNVWADVYRGGPGTLEHAQLVADGRVGYSAAGTRVPAGLALARDWEVDPAAPPPELDSGAARLDTVLAETVPVVGSGGGSGGVAEPGAAPALDGVTIVEIGSFFAAPFGATVLAEQGARVIKIEPAEGDAIRHLMPFPELSGIKVLQGKESVVLDLATPEGHAAMIELVRRADVVLQSFRAGVVDRLACAPAHLVQVKPDLVYVSAPGYGEGPPCGHRPAFAPTMGAASGMAVRNVGGLDLVPRGPDLDLVTVKRTSMRLASGASSPANSDGVAALGVATAMAIGIYGLRRHGRGDVLRTSMLSTVAHALADTSVVGAHGTPSPAPDDQLLGLGPLHRLYETADGWVMCAVERPSARATLAATLGVDLYAPDVAERLADAFRGASAREWEDRLLPEGVAVVAASPYGLDRTFVVGDIADELGLRATALHPTLDEYPRASALVRFSRSRSVLGDAPLCGDHTDAVLTELAADRSASAP
jgi:crotonobetainyl-CoA:carnitine CoA-transferase CaiB-like acyl-CoA transferase